MKAPIILLIVVLIATAAGMALYATQKQEEVSVPVPTPVQTEERYMDIETYMRTSISELSPIESQLGGTFFVTDIQIEDGTGVVEYEDGHNAYTADFTYVIAENGKPEVLSFTVR